ncbi:hypothetical protein POJ06DRAFT_242662 [Lipomyces tetrasporus]|uniref:CRAL-TRIO domain-containing protein n=1 Tax=Lipomyces tetrasporus TaxID=54092 RepID=A0AAD7VWA5_9ASCO|nr:uncharacterized protein POJ06DRAFT_242662 [Lipomyces tetrasporus]KAJ8103719.1 hypothetical protein POJ06DRAFT_242662 [Lipomyces tetrasporus]
MNATLESFIDPANLPNKYGGELDFEFGQMPVLDPAVKNALTWEGSYEDSWAYILDRQGRLHRGNGRRRHGRSGEAGKILHRPKESDGKFEE